MIDIGANLAHEDFARDLDAVLERAWAAGLEGALVTGSDADSARRARELAHAHPGRLWATAGLHPHHAAGWDEAHAALFRELAADPCVVSLGECGLDYHRDFSPREAQRRTFAAQLALAAELGKPLFLHQREAHADFLPMLREHRAALPGAVVHCFTDTRAAMEECLALDCHIGITGWVCDERRGTALAAAVPHIPEDRLLVETDAPYLLPRTIRPRPKSRRNEPAHLVHVVARLAELRGTDAAALGRATADNARRLFGLGAGA